MKKFFLAGFLSLYSATVFAETRTVSVVYMLSGWAQKPVESLILKFQEINQATYKLALQDPANQNRPHEDRFSCRMESGEMSLAVEGDVLVKTHLICRGENEKVLKSFQVEKFLEETLSREVGIPIRKDPLDEPPGGSAIVHN